jgi:anti-sigma factor RsiW
MLQSGEGELLPEESLALKEHLEKCSECAAFLAFWKGLGSQLREGAGPALSSELSERVRLRCLADVYSPSRRRAGQDFGRGPAGVPWPVWAALLVLTGLTLVFLIPGLEQFRQSQKFTLGTALGLLIIFQNALMLFAAPLLMRRGRLSRYYYS